MYEFKKIPRKIFHKSSFVLLLTSFFLFSSFSQEEVDLVNVKLINIKDCVSCSTKATEELLHNVFRGLVFEKIDYRSKKAKELIDMLEEETLPLFIFDSGIVKRKNFSDVSHSFIKKDSFYILKPEFSGIFYYLNRPEIPGRIDLFIDIYAQDCLSVLKKIKSLAKEKELTLDVHFLFRQKDQAGIEECRRILSIKRLYPEKFWDYLFKRLENIDTSYWNLPMEELGLDVKKIVSFALSEKAEELLEENSALTKQLNIGSSYVMLVNNNRIFSVSSGAEGSLESLLDEVI